MDYNDPEYLKLFKNVNKKEDENLNEKKQDFSQYENLSKKNYDGFQRLIETPQHNYNISENLNDGWKDEFTIEVRANGVTQKPNTPFQMPTKKYQKSDPNGLNQFIDEDEDLREIYKPAIPQPQVTRTGGIPQPMNINEKLTEVDVVTLEMFERINNAAFITLANSKGLAEIKNYR